MSLDAFKEISQEELQINPFQEFKQWALATAGKSVTDCNSLTIGWGNLGVLMSQNICTVYVRQPRHSFQFFEKSDYFTVCIFDEKYKKDLTYMGTKSGRDGNKYEATGLKPIMIDNAVGIEQAKRIYVCETIYKGPVSLSGIKESDVKKKFYDDSKPEDCHHMYTGKILKILDRK